jgi:hypothetical protein
MALQFEPFCCPELGRLGRALDPTSCTFESATALPNQQTPPRSLPELDDRSSSSGSSVPSDPAEWRGFDFPTQSGTRRESNPSRRPSHGSDHERKSYETSHQPDSRESSRLPEFSTGVSVDGSYDQIVHPVRGEGLFLMCKRDASIDHRPTSHCSTLEALPEYNEWECQDFYTTLSEASHSMELYFADAERTRREDRGLWRKSYEQLRRKGSKILRRSNEDVRSSGESFIVAAGGY